MGEMELIKQIELAKRGDQDALGFLYTKYRHRVHSLCLKMVKRHEDAEDLTQDVFMQLVKKIHQFQGTAQFTTWLHTVTRNIVFMKFRKLQYRAERSQISLDQLMFDDDDETHSLDIPVYDPEPFTMQQIKDALPDTLSPKQREIFLRTMYLGETPEELCERFGTTKLAVKSTLHKARQKIAEHIR